MIEDSLFKEQKDITVSIVTYNSANDIDTLMASLQKSSSFNDMTVFVVDNASTDNTLSILQENYPWVRCIENEENIGFGRAHNIVIRNIKSKYHIVINPDVSIFTNTVATSVSFMENNLDVAIITPCVMNLDGTQQFLPKKNPSIKYLLGGMFEKKFKFCKKLRDEYTLRNRQIDNPIDVEACTGAFMFMRTKALLKVGGFDERYFLHFEDADLTRELKKIGRAVYNPDILVTHKWHRDNKKINKSFWIALRSMFIYMNKWRGESMRSSNYSFGELVYNFKCVIGTKMKYRGARLVRTPIAVRGKQCIDFGIGLTTGKNCQIEVNGDHDGYCLKFGTNVNIGHNVRIQCAESITIGNNVLMGSRITIIDNSHGSYSDSNQDSPFVPPNERPLKSAPINIGNNVWIGDGVVIQKGVTIGAGSIIAANSVVTKDIPEAVIAGGIPARILRVYNEKTHLWEKYR